MNYRLVQMLPRANGFQSRVSNTIINSPAYPKSTQRDFLLSSRNMSLLNQRSFVTLRKYLQYSFTTSQSMYQTFQNPKITFLILGAMTQVTNDKTTGCSNDGSDIKDIISKAWQNVKDGKLDSTQLDEMMNALSSTLGSHTKEALDSGLPGKLSYGFVCGVSSGYALKKVGRVAAVGVGLGFAIMQTLSYNGYITVDFDQMSNDFQKAMDWNQDGNVDELDVQELSQKIYKAMSFNVPAGSGFGAGFVLGVRNG